MLSKELRVKLKYEFKVPLGGFRGGFVAFTLTDYQNRIKNYEKSV